MNLFHSSSIRTFHSRFRIWSLLCKSNSYILLVFTDNRSTGDFYYSQYWLLHGVQEGDKPWSLLCRILSWDSAGMCTRFDRRCDEYTDKCYDPHGGIFLCLSQ